MYLIEPSERSPQKAVDDPFLRRRSNPRMAAGVDP